MKEQLSVIFSQLMNNSGNVTQIGEVIAISKETNLYRVESEIGEVHFLVDGGGGVTGVLPDNLNVQYPLGDLREDFGIGDTYENTMDIMQPSKWP